MHILTVFILKSIKKKLYLLKNKAETNKHPTPAPHPPPKKQQQQKIKINKTNTSIQKIILQKHVIDLLNTGIYNYKYKLFPRHILK